MLRALKFGAGLLACVLLLSESVSAETGLETYELGPFQVVGLGVDGDDAAADANAKMFAMLFDIQNGLPEGHVYLDYAIDNEGLIDPNEYQIVFYVIVWIPDGPGPPGGGL